MSFVSIFLGIFQGFGITAGVTLYGLCFAVPFALLFGVAQFVSTGVPLIAVTAIIEFWRSSSVILLLFVFYYVFPVVGIQLSAITVSAMVLGLNAGAYASQSIRAGLESLDRGQTEAAIALGLRRGQSLVLVELPQALTRMLPTFFNQFIQLIKGTSLVSLVTLTDMTFRAKELAEIEYNPAGIYIALLLSYFVVCYPVTLIGRWTEQRIGTTGQVIDDL